MWSWQNLLAAELSPVFVYCRTHTTVQTVQHWPVNPFQLQSNPWGREQLLCGVWALPCGVWAMPAQLPIIRGPTVPLEGNCKRCSNATALLSQDQESQSCVGLLCLQCTHLSQRPKLKLWMVLWLFIMSLGTFIVRLST